MNSTPEYVFFIVGTEMKKEHIGFRDIGWTHSFFGILFISYSVSNQHKYFVLYFIKYDSVK